MADKRTRPFEFVQPAGVVRRVSVLHAFDPDQDGGGGEFFFSVILSFRTRQREREYNFLLINLTRPHPKTLHHNVSLMLFFIIVMSIWTPL